MKIICLFVAHLPVQVEQQGGAPDTVPLVVGGRPWDPGSVLDCSSAAASAGVRLGMRLARAAQVCPGATFVPAREAVYCEAHVALDAMLRQYTDRVETAGLGYLFADVSDLRVPAGRDPTQTDVELARSLAREVQQVNALDARIGLAPQRFTAEQAARATRPRGWCPIQSGQERTFLSPLSIETLPRAPEMDRRLHLLGITTLGTLAALPRAAIVRQFGADAGLFHDLAAGRDPRGVYPDAPPLVVERSHQCEPPLCDGGPLIARVARLGESAATDLVQRKHQAQGLTLTLEDEVGKAHIVSTAIEPPTADIDQLKRQAVGLATRVTHPRRDPYDPDTVSPAPGLSGSDATGPVYRAQRCARARPAGDLAATASTLRRTDRYCGDEALRCGIQIFGADVQASDVAATANGNGIRLGLATVSGVGESGGAQIVAAREYGPFTSLTDFCQRTRLGRRAVEALILGGAFDGWRIPRWQLVWDLSAAMETIGGLPQLGIVEPGTRPAFPQTTDTERLWMELATTGVTPVAELSHWPDGTKLRVGGVIIARQRPPTARGTAFIALEDEGGVVNVVLRPEVFAAYHEVLKSRFVMIEGTLQRRGRVCGVVGERVLAVEG